MQQITPSKPELEVLVQQFHEKGKHNFTVNISARGMPPDDGKELPTKIPQLVDYVKSIEQKYSEQYHITLYVLIDDPKLFWDMYLSQT